MIKLNPYLNFDGNTEEAFNFYKSVFGGELIMLTRFKDTPEGIKLSDEDKEKIMHVSLPINKDVTLMATDVLKSMGQKLELGNNFSLCISTESENDADRFFEKLSKGGKIEMPMAKTFWNAYFGMVLDKFGIRWMISYDLKK